MNQVTKITSCQPSPICTCCQSLYDTWVSSPIFCSMIMVHKCCFLGYVLWVCEIEYFDSEFESSHYKKRGIWHKAKTSCTTVWKSKFLHFDILWSEVQMK